MIQIVIIKSYKYNDSNRIIKSYKYNDSNSNY